MRITAMGSEENRPVDHETSSEPSAAGQRPDAAPRVLAVVEDPTIRHLISEVLAVAGWSSRTAGEGRSALEIAETEPVDVLVTDLFLPDTTGIDLAFDLRMRSPDLPVLILERYREDASGEIFRLPVGTQILAKPFRPKELVERLEQVLARACA